MGGRLLTLLVLALLLGGCSSTIINPVAAARATAAAGGCWPDHLPQPATPFPITPTPTVPVYPRCTPGPLTPTPTPTLIPPPPPVAMQPRPAQSTVGAVAGAAVPWARAVRSPVLAIHPERATAAVAWLGWSETPDAELDGALVWARAQDEGGGWGLTQSVNLGPVRRFYGGLGLAYAGSDTLVLVWGSGGAGGPLGAHTIWVATSTDAGASWSAPAAIQRGRVLDLARDSTGGLHLLAVDPARPEDLTGPALYGTLAPGAASWQWTALGGRDQYNGALALAPLPDGHTRRFALLNNAANGGAQALLVRSSDDGRAWTAGAQLPLGRSFAEQVIIAVSLVAVPRPDGSIAVVAAWSQIPGPGPARGGLFASASFDGGSRWSDEEIIALHRPDGLLFEPKTGAPLRGGFEPSLVYDAATDQVAVAWLEDDMARRGTAYGAHIHTMLSSRPLRPKEDWRARVTPDLPDDFGALELRGWGIRGALVGTPDGRSAWLVGIDTRNGANEIVVGPLELRSLIQEGAG